MAVPVAVAPDVAPVGTAAPRAAAAIKGPDIHSNAGWTKRLGREDELLVEQVVAAGCDVERAKTMRELLQRKAEHRARTIADHEAGKITDDELDEAARTARVRLDNALAELLAPNEIEALDPIGARAQVLAEEKRR